MTPPTINAAQLARLLGVSIFTIYEGAKAGTLPVEPIRVGQRRMVWPSATVAALLGVESLDSIDLDDLDHSDEEP